MADRGRAEQLGHARRHPAAAHLLRPQHAGPGVRLAADLRLSALRLSPHHPRRAFHRWQHWYIWFLLPAYLLIAFFADIEPSLRIDADQEHLFRIMTNLVRNAMQAIESVEGKTDGAIHVAAKREGRKVIVDVLDNGDRRLSKRRRDPSNNDSGSNDRRFHPMLLVAKDCFGLLA